MCVYACGCAPQREAAALRLRTTATAVRLGTRAEGALHGERSYRCAKVVDERSMRDHHVACSKNSDGRLLLCAESFSCSLSEVLFDEANSLLRKQHILGSACPPFFFSRVLYSFWERSSVPPLSGRFSQVRAREGGL